MTTSSRVKALLELTETDQNTFAAAFGMTTPQAMSNKLRRDSWSARDLAKAAALCGAKLAFILPDGSQLILAPDEECPLHRKTPRAEEDKPPGAGRFACIRLQQNSSLSQHSAQYKLCSHEKVSVHAGFQAKTYNVYSNSYPDPE